MKKQIIDLAGEQGNAFFILSLASKKCKALGIDFTPINDDMTSSDYDHLIKVFKKHFSQYFILKNKP